VGNAQLQRPSDDPAHKHGRKAMMSEPTFVASRDGLCGFVLVVEDGQVDAYTPSGNLLGVFRDRIEAAEAVLQNEVVCCAVV